MFLQPPEPARGYASLVQTSILVRELRVPRTWNSLPSAMLFADNNDNSHDESAVTGAAWPFCA